MANSLIACGGTGAHVALALMRLHTLGYALGFFRSSNDRRLDFPTLYLVDQDAGDGEQDATAWQMVRRLAEAHPGRHDRRETISREEGISVRVVTPLPIGGDRDWFAAPNDTLRKRFGESPYLDLLTDREQRDIEFSRGMMGSPAVGALLFHLKKYDVMPSGVNLDGDFQALRKERGRIAVVGSGVGGTGAAVAPTLARQLAAADGNHVMAVMLLDWFRFRTDDADDALREKADLRNDAMRRNAHSALAYCGRALADAAAAVPVGVPERALVERRYTSDTQQPTCESFVHGVAALCSLRHFLAGEPYSRGLYQMGAADPATLGGGNAIPGGTLQDLANQAATLADALNVFATVLSSSHSGRFGVVPALHAAVRRLAAADPGQTAQALRALAARYREHLDWLRKVGVEPRPVRALTVEARSRERLIDHKISDHRNLSAEAAAHALFHWVADWIREYRGTRPDGLVMRPTPANGGYWPPLSPGEGISTAADAAGELTRIRDQNIDATLKGFVQTAQISENGWPYPIAVADHFRHAIRNEDPKATRQLEMLLAGLVSGTLMLQEVPPPGTSSAPVSLDALVEEFREEEFPDLGRYEVVWPDKNYEVLGFNAPHTLLCAKPPAEPHAARIWALLWEKLTGSSRPENWATEVRRTVWTHVDRAVRQIRAWLGHLKKAHPGVPPPWTRIFELQSESTPIAHGHDSREFSVYWSSGEPVRIALPTAKSGGYRPHPGTTFLPENELLAEIPELRRLEDASGRMLFELVDFEAPNRERPVRALWREHLEHLQQRGLIAGFGGGGKDAEETVFIWLRDRSRSAKLSKTRVLDRERIMVKRCSPMRQDPVPGSTRKPRETCYPDLPLRSEYIGLVQTDGGKPLLDALKAGDTSSSAPPALRPVVDDRTRGQSATWTLQLAGHGDPLPIVLPVAPDEDHHQAHWMVWPRFRSTHHPTGSLGDAPEGAFWRAYYVYEHCTDARLHLETLWLEPDSNRVQRCEAPERSGSHPVRFEVGDRRRHTGGPPLAFSARHAATGEEVGLYLIRLQRLSANDSDVRVGIDFGTSHTVCGRSDGGRALVRRACP